MLNFGEVLTAMVTPFDANLQVDYEAAGNLANYLLDNGSDGIVVCGTTGESPTLTEQEKLKLFRVVVEAVGQRGKVIAGTGSYNTAETIHLTKEAEKIGVDGVMLVAPYYNKPSQDGLYAHFAAVAAATSLPVIIYNIPGRTSINVSVATLVKLAEIKNIVAVKEATGNLFQISQIRQSTPADFLIYSGDDALTLPILSIGGAGVISVSSHVVGKQMKEMITAYQKGEVAKAAQLNATLGPLFRTLFITANPTMVKAACNRLGVKVGGLRLPLLEAKPEEVAILEKVLQQLELV